MSRPVRAASAVLQTRTRLPGGTDRFQLEGRRHTASLLPFHNNKHMTRGASGSDAKQKAWVPCAFVTRPCTNRVQSMVVRILSLDEGCHPGSGEYRREKKTKNKTTEQQSKRINGYRKRDTSVDAASHLYFLPWLHSSSSGWEQRTRHGEGFFFLLLLRLLFCRQQVFFFFFSRTPQRTQWYSRQTRVCQYVTQDCTLRRTLTGSSALPIKPPGDKPRQIS